MAPHNLACPEERRGAAILKSLPRRQQNHCPRLTKTLSCLISDAGGPDVGVVGEGSALEGAVPWFVRFCRVEQIAPAVENSEYDVGDKMTSDDKGLVVTVAIGREGRGEIEVGFAGECGNIWNGGRGTIIGNGCDKIWHNLKSCVFFIVRKCAVGDWSDCFKQGAWKISFLNSIALNAILPAFIAIPLQVNSVWIV